MFELLIGIGIGFVLGIIVGLIPGFHPNLLATLLLTVLFDYSLFPIIVVMLVVASFFSFLRSIFLFVPEESHALAMHPMFQFVKQRKALVALKLCVYGLLISIIVSILLSPALIIILPVLYEYLRHYIPFFLLFVSCYLILSDKKPHFAVVIFLLAGLIGYFGLNSLNQPLLIMLTGFFGFPILLQLKKKIPRQIVSYKFDIERDSIVRGVGSSFIAGFLAIFLPAVSPAQASLLSRGLLKKSEDFLISIGAISGFNITFSTMLLHSVGRARVGSLSMLGQRFSVDLYSLILIFLLFLTFGIISYLLVLKLGKKFYRMTEKINYKYLAIGVIIFISAMALFFDSFLGIVFLAAATSIGYLASRLKTRTAHCMGCLIIPVLLFYFI